MNVSEPEADTEYSRGPVGSEGGERPGAAASATTRIAVAGGALVASALLFAAEFLPLFTVRTSARDSVVKTVQGGSHHSYALLPIALLAAGLALNWWRSPRRLPVLALAGAVLGVTALVIALGRDLPDAQSHGIERSGATYVSAAASPRAGLYVETAGAIVLLITSAGGFLLGPTPDGGVQTISSRRRSAS
jgi:hypothetical protein